MSIPISLVRDDCDDLIDAFDYIGNISSMIEERYHGDQLQANRYPRAEPVVLERQSRCTTSLCG
ncbi:MULTISPECIES: hypothetical protein [Cysteiniphilum]|uniref:hypothetical protein n=1 Tax=Cysteiniphilum TaxID=2056696 RepID=UPI000E348B12|nr:MULTISPECIES: hypothetical protein [Cysteiniphilum]